MYHCVVIIHMKYNRGVFATSTEVVFDRKRMLVGTNMYIHLFSSLTTSISNKYKQMMKNKEWNSVDEYNSDSKRSVVSYHVQYHFATCALKNLLWHCFCFAIIIEDRILISSTWLTEIQRVSYPEYRSQSQLSKKFEKMYLSICWASTLQVF